jgi:hypothetical protein
MSRPGCAHQLARAGEARDVAQLAEDRERCQLPDPVLGEQRPAALLAAGELAQLPLERRQLDVESVDQGERDSHPLARRRRQLEPLQVGAPFAAEQACWDLRSRDAVVKERRPNPLQPLRPLLDERPAQARARAPCEHVLGRLPGLGQAPLSEQLAQVTRVRAVGLCAPLAATQRARLRRLGQVRRRTSGAQLLAHEQPAGRRLDRDLNALAGKALHPGADSGAARLDPAAAELTRFGIEGIKGDLSSMHVEPGYDRHQGPPLRSGWTSYANDLALSQGRPCFMPSSSGIAS